MLTDNGGPGSGRRVGGGKSAVQMSQEHLADSRRASDLRDAVDRHTGAAKVNARIASDKADALSSTPGFSAKSC